MLLDICASETYRKHCGKRGNFLFATLMFAMSSNTDIKLETCCLCQRKGLIVSLCMYSIEMDFPEL